MSEILRKVYCGFNIFTALSLTRPTSFPREIQESILFKTLVVRNLL